eukprot:1161382-Pelagomonas_calceolata.AAC.4
MQQRNPMECLLGLTHSGVAVFLRLQVTIHLFMSKRTSQVAGVLAHPLMRPSSPLFFLPVWVCRPCSDMRACVGTECWVNLRSMTVQRWLRILKKF